MKFEVNGYIDETTLNDIDGTNEFHTVVISFLKSLKLILSNEHVSVNLFRSRRLLTTQLSCGNDFQYILNNSTPKELKVLLKNKMFKMTKEWEGVRCHSPNDYFEFAGECYTDFTLAEVVESNINGFDSQLIQFNSPLSLSIPHLFVCKDGCHPPIKIDVLCTQEKYDAWVVQRFHPTIFCYDYTANIPPTDNQTMLKQRDRFKDTCYLNQGRVVYQEITSKRYFCVDNLHYAQAAHIEVWDKRGLYLGEVDLGGINAISLKQTKHTKNNPSWLN
jgi:hypothetical protein